MSLTLAKSKSFSRSLSLLCSLFEPCSHIQTNIYDFRKNFIQVLGPVWYLWLIPVRNSVGNGWSFPANDYGKSMLSTDNHDDDGVPRFHRRGAPSVASSFGQLDHSNSSEEHHRLQTQHPYPRQHPQQQQHHHYPQHDLSAYGDRFGLTTDSDLQSSQGEAHYRQDLSYDLENHVRPDSDADSDNDGPFGRSNRYPAPTPRRLRQYRPGFAPSNAPVGQQGRQVQDSDDEDEDDDDERYFEQDEYVYDSDEMGHTIA